MFTVNSWLLNLHLNSEEEKGILLLDQMCVCVWLTNMQNLQVFLIKVSSRWPHTAHSGTQINSAMNICYRNNITYIRPQSRVTQLSSWLFKYDIRVIAGILLKGLSNVSMSLNFIARINFLPESWAEKNRCANTNAATMNFKVIWEWRTLACSLLAARW